MHIHIDQGVSFSKLAKKYQNSKVGKITFGALWSCWLHSGPLCDGMLNPKNPVPKRNFEFLTIYNLHKQNGRQNVTFAPL